MDPQLDHLLPRLENWAQGQPNVVRLWVYGSRLKGVARSDSDLDVCVQIDPLLTEEAKRLFQNHLVSWAIELTALFGMKVHIEPYATDQQRALISDCSKLVYQRAS